MCSTRLIGLIPIPIPPPAPATRQAGEANPAYTLAFPFPRLLGSLIKES